MMVSYIVSAYNRPEFLRCCLASLLVQSARDFEIIVTDNATDAGMRSRNFLETMEASMPILDVHVTYHNPRLETCYHSAEYGASLATGKYLCFPSDDSYYVPKFQELMVAEAEAKELQLVYCEMVYNPRLDGQKYHLLNVRAQLNWIDKTGFLVRRDVFAMNGFKAKDITPAADGYFIDDIVRQGIRHGRYDGILAVHN
jgi:hypothetical protein